MKKNLLNDIERILTTDIPGTPKLKLRVAAKHIGALLQSEIPGTPSREAILRAVETALTTDVSTPAVTFGRVQYRRLRGSVKGLSARAQQVVAALDAHKGVGTAKDLQAWLKVNRNVIAGALHELRQANLIRSEALEA